MTKILQFIKYNNIFPIVLGVVFLGGGAALAAPQIIETIGSVTEVDTSYIRDVDLDNFDTDLRVLSVEETETDYLVTYEFNTVLLMEGVWQRASKQDSMTIAKVALLGTDLESYLLKQLKEVVDAEITYLKQVQEYERTTFAAKESSRVAGFSGLSLNALLGRTQKERELIDDVVVIEESEPEVEYVIVEGAGTSTATSTSPTTPTESPEPSEPTGPVDSAPAAPNPDPVEPVIPTPSEPETTTESDPEPSE